MQKIKENPPTFTKDVHQELNAEKKFYYKKYQLTTYNQVTYTTRRDKTECKLH